MTIVRALLPLALLCVLSVLGSGTLRAQESFPPGRDCALCLDFEKVVDEGLVCAATGAACRVSGQVLTQQGAVHATPCNNVLAVDRPAVKRSWIAGTASVRFTTTHGLALYPRTAVTRE